MEKIALPLTIPHLRAQRNAEALKSREYSAAVELEAEIFAAWFG